MGKLKATAKAVDGAVDKLRLYHGTPNELYGPFDSGTYFAPDPNYASQYAKHYDPEAPDQMPAVYPVDVDLDGIIDTRVGAGKELWDEFRTDRSDFLFQHDSGLPDHNDESRFTSWLMEEKGLDPAGVWVDENNGQTALKVFDPARIKSAYAGSAAAAVGLGAAVQSEESEAVTAARSFLASREQKRGQWDSLRDGLMQALYKANDGATFAMEALEVPWKGLLGASRVAGGLVSGESFDQAVNQGANQVRQPIDQTAYDLGGAATDYTGSPTVGAAVNAGVQMGGPI